MLGGAIPGPGCIISPTNLKFLERERGREGNSEEREASGVSFGFK